MLPEKKSGTDADMDSDLEAAATDGRTISPSHNRRTILVDIVRETG
jgi:hypothetical protein